jgi:hypothetical protein
MTATLLFLYRDKEFTFDPTMTWVLSKITKRNISLLGSDLSLLTSGPLEQERTKR